MIVAIVALVGVLAGAVLTGLRYAVTDAEPLDVERDEQWLVRHAPGWLADALRYADRRVAGGAAVAALFAVVLAAALFVGWVFSTLDDDSRGEARGFAAWDESAAEWGARNATDTSTSILKFVTDFGGTGYLLVAMAGIGLYHRVRHSDWGPFVYLAVVGVGVSALNNGMKLIIDRDRPDIGQLAGHAGSSFPSGHSAAAAACWAAIALVVARRRSRPLRAWLAFVAAAIALAVAATRVLLGVHWLTDVIAGVVVGWCWFFVTTIVFGGRLLRLGEPARRIALADDADETTPAPSGAVR